jgi:hypothetical protein
VSSEKKDKAKHGKKDHERGGEPAPGKATPASGAQAAGPGGSAKSEDRPRYAEFKVLLRPDRLRRIIQAFDLWQHIRGAVEQAGVRYTPIHGEPAIRQRDVMFYDTPDFRLYENHFILRRRTHFRDGWTTAHDELTFKFRHPEEERVRAVDMRPGLLGNARIKFKREILPLTDRVGGIRHIYTQNCVLTMPPVEEGFDLEQAAELFPALHDVASGDHVKIGLVNRVTVNETLTEFGVLDFGKDLEGVASLALWRDTQSSAPIVSELGFQLKFEELDDEVEERLTRIEGFFKLLQHLIAPWLFLGTTKTNLVYQREGHEVKNRE